MKWRELELVDYKIARGPGKKRFEYSIVEKATGEEIGYADGLNEAVKMVNKHRTLVKEGKHGYAILPKRSVRQLEDDSSA